MTPHDVCASCAVEISPIQLDLLQTNMTHISGSTNSLDPPGRFLPISEAGTPSLLHRCY